MWLGGYMVEKATGIQTLPDVIAPPRKTDEQREDEEKVKFRAYSMLADVVGAKHRYQADKIRVLCTILQLEASGVSSKDIFEYQKELVVPGWGRRRTESWNYVLNRYTYVPKRYESYIEYIDPNITAKDRNEGLSLAREVKSKKLCPLDWKAIVIIRPYRDNTAGNQKPDEIKAIREKMIRVELAPDEKSEFEFYKLPSKPESGPAKKG